MRSNILFADARLISALHMLPNCFWNLLRILNVILYIWILSGTISPLASAYRQNHNNFGRPQRCFLLWNSAQKAIIVLMMSVLSQSAGTDPRVDTGRALPRCRSYHFSETLFMFPMFRRRFFSGLRESGTFICFKLLLLFF